MAISSRLGKGSLMHTDNDLVGIRHVRFKVSTKFSLGKPVFPYAYATRVH
jgi:hypothetical protein